MLFSDSVFKYKQARITRYLRKASDKNETVTRKKKEL